MIFYRRYSDYLRLYWRIFHRLIVSTFFFVVGAAVFFANIALAFFSGVDVVRGLVLLVSLLSIFVSGYFIFNDWKKARSDRFDVLINEDENFHRNASTLSIEPETIFKIVGEYLVWYDPKINPVLDEFKTELESIQPRYEVPFPLKHYVTKAVNKRKPTSDDSKVGLRSDVNFHNLSMGRMKVQHTTYFSGISTNEITPCRVVLINRKQDREELICSLFEDYVSEGGKLIPLGKSILSNHIGVTTLVVTRDPCIVLQWQGDTQVDKKKINVGASGSADWDDVGESPDEIDADGRSKKTLQNLVRYAMEREVREELSATVGAQFSKTTITGYARYVHRGGKPEFFGITFLDQEYAALRIRRQERKWILRKESRAVKDHSNAALIESVKSLEREFDPQITRAASISMLICLQFAREHLEKSETVGASIPLGFGRTQHVEA